jgi:hypothetical protein
MRTAAAETGTRISRPTKRRFTPMKTTFVLSLDEDTAAFLDQVRNRPGNEDPNVFINRLLRQEMQRTGMPVGQTGKQSGGIKELENFVDTQIPSAG